MTNRKLRDSHGEEVVRFDINLNATVEITKLEWEAYLESNESDKDDAMWELANAVEGNEFPIPDGRCWITGTDNISILEGG